jgi:hypothetical protein
MQKCAFLVDNRSESNNCELQRCKNFQHHDWPKLFIAYNNAGVVVVNSGANPTIASYNASVVKFYNATDSLECFENKIIFFYFEKRSSLLHTTLAL